jgi:hypothetical protein
MLVGWKTLDTQSISSTIDVYEEERKRIRRRRRRRRRRTELPLKVLLDD